MSSQIKAPTLSDVLAEFRQKLGLSKEKFAERLDVSRIAVLQWESGISQPSMQNFLALARLAQQVLPERAMWLYEKAGITPADMRALVPNISKQLRADVKRLKELKSKRGIRASTGLEVYLPLIGATVFRGSASSVEESLYRQVPDGLEWISFPVSSVPHPEATLCVRAADAFMYPVFSEGDIVAVDGNLTVRAAAYSEINGRQTARSVAAWASEQPILIAAYHARKRRGPVDAPREGVHIRSIVRSESKIYLESAVGNVVASTPRHLWKDLWTPDQIKESETVEVGETGEWLVLGTVVAWIGTNRDIAILKK